MSLLTVFALLQRPVRGGFVRENAENRTYFFSSSFLRKLYHSCISAMPSDNW